MNEYYYRNCEECEYLYHCFGRCIGEKIKDGDTDDMYLYPDACINFYPEI